MMTTDDAFSDFVSATRSAFDGVASAAGLQLASTEDTRVVYTSPKVELAIYHGRRSKEIGVEVSLRSTADSCAGPFSLGTVLQAVAPQVGRNFRGWTATTPDSLAKGVAVLAGHLEKWGGDVLAGDKAVFARLAKQGAENAMQLGVESLVNRNLPAAGVAFKEGRYREVVRLLSEIETQLSRAERKKLEIAKRRAT